MKTIALALCLLTLSHSLAHAESPNGPSPTERTYRSGRSLLITGLTIALINAVAATVLIATGLHAASCHDCNEEDIAGRMVAILGGGTAIAVGLGGLVLTGVGHHMMSTASPVQVAPLVDHGALRGGALSYTFRF